MGGLSKSEDIRGERPFSSGTPAKAEKGRKRVKKAGKGQKRWIAGREARCPVSPFVTPPFTAAHLYRDGFSTRLQYADVCVCVSVRAQDQQFRRIKSVGSPVLTTGKNSPQQIPPRDAAAKQPSMAQPATLQLQHSCAASL